MFCLDRFKEGVSYDYDFTLGNKTFYCSELIYNAFNRPKEVKFKRWVMPNDLICPIFKEVLRVPASGKELK